MGKKMLYLAGCKCPGVIPEIARKKFLLELWIVKPLFSNRIQVYTETGRKKVFAGVIDWPGWCRMGTDEKSALQALFDIAPRYAAALKAAQIDFALPDNLDDFTVIERLKGNATTDFGAPNLSPSDDERLVSQEEFSRQQALIMACWQAFDSAVIAASGRELKTGPRGGGRDLPGILQHMIESDASNLARLAWKYSLKHLNNPVEELGPLRQATLNAFARLALGELPQQAPSTSELWTARHFARNLAWHTLDHAWEIEDRII